MRNFSYLNATLALERHTSVYWFLYFLMYPIYACMVLISFGLKDTGARVTTCSSAILAVVIQWIAVFATLPSIPQYTVIDQWILGHTIWMILAILYHTGLHLWINVNEGQRSRFNENSKISEPANEGRPNQADSNDDSSSTSTISEWTVTLKKNLSDGSVTRVEGQDNLIIRSFKDFYYLQTYLQAKYPEFIWPRIPLHNVLTNADQMHIYKMREDYISDMVRLLQPDVWRHHSEIEEVMQSFIGEDEWHGSKWYSRYRRYIVSSVDSAGHKTGPDLFAFVAFLVGYTLFVPFLLYAKWTNGKYLFCGIIPSALIIVSVIYAKYRSMRPPTLWHTNVKLERNKKRNDIQTEEEPQIETIETRPLLN